MNAPTRLLEWTEANQRLLVAEFARIKRLLRGEETAAAQEEIDAARAALPAPAAIDRIAERFGLSPFERDVLLLAAGAEMDAEIASLCARAAGDARRCHASFALALATLPEAHWSALIPPRPLRRWRLVDIADETAPTTARLVIDERTLHALAGIDYLDTRLQPLLRMIRPTPIIATAHERIRDEIAAAIAKARAPLPAFQLVGNDAHGKRDVAAGAAASCGLQLYALSSDDVPSAPHEVAAVATLWEREAVLSDAALLLEAGELAPGSGAWRFAERLAGLTFVSTPEPAVLERPVLTYRVDKPGRDEQLRLWHRALGDAAQKSAPMLEAIAAELRLSAHDISRAATALSEPSSAVEPARQLWDACRVRDTRRLGNLAQRLEAGASWDDLVLPEPQLATLRQIAVHLRHRITVLERWGFAAKSGRGTGIAVLFAGESGTGKTMAAEALANDLGLELYRIDLSSVVSKYIGETEKNLARVFDAAEDSGAVLLFDEADALFGKRSDVKDSHDRYANIEVSYLLQRMEAYRGLAILTTNQKSALDPAFQRRLRFVVHFPFPDAAHREAIWRRIFPAALPTRGIDFAKLARLHVTGGSIRNIALNAAFLAADAGTPLGMAHLLEAARGEAGKRERAPAESEIRGWI